MDDISHNLLEGYYSNGTDGSGNPAFYYNELQANGNLYRVDFTRVVTSSGITLNITNTINSLGYPANATDLTALNGYLNTLVGIPLNGDECITLGWTYLGHISTNKPNIDAAIASASASGYTFQSLFYQAGYFVYGCIPMKLFYDQG